MKKIIFTIAIFLYSLLVQAQIIEVKFTFQGKEYSGIQVLPTDSTSLDVLATDVDSLFTAIYFDCKEVIISDDTDICYLINIRGESVYTKFINVRQRKGQFSLKPYLID